MNSFEIINKINANKAELAGITTALGVTSVGVVKAHNATQIVAGATAHPQAIATATVTTSSGQTIILSKVAATALTKALLIGSMALLGVLIGYGIYIYLKKDSPAITDEDKSAIEEAINEELNKD